MRLGPLNPDDPAIAVYPSLPPQMPWYLGWLRLFNKCIKEETKGGVFIRTWHLNFTIETKYLGEDHERYEID